MRLPIHLRNTSLRGLTDEWWKELPGFDGNYMLSNYGRLKSLSRLVERPQGSYETAEKILAPRTRVQKQKNAMIGQVWAQITYAHRKHVFPLSRWVHYLFVKKFNMKDRKLVVMYQDSNPLNIHYTNLLLSTRKELMKQTYGNGRNREAFGRKPKIVTQYTLKGKKVGTYQSLNEAERATGADAGAISEVARGIRLQYKGSVWKYGK